MGVQLPAPTNFERTLDKIVSAYETEDLRLAHKIGNVLLANPYSDVLAHPGAGRVAPLLNVGADHLPAVIGAVNAALIARG